MAARRLLLDGRYIHSPRWPLGRSVWTQEIVHNRLLLVRAVDPDRRLQRLLAFSRLLRILSWNARPRTGIVVAQRDRHLE